MQLKVKPDEKGILLKGHLLNKNWYGNKQLRYFELYPSGELKYYKDITDKRGSIMLGPESNIRKTGRSQLTMFCTNKKKEYIILQAEPNQINYQAERFRGRCF